MVALLDALAVLRRRRDGKPDLDDAGVQRARQLEARVLEDAEHGDVLGQNLGDEHAHARLGRADGELFDQPCPCTVPL